MSRYSLESIISILSHSLSLSPALYKQIYIHARAYVQTVYTSENENIIWFLFFRKKFRVIRIIIVFRWKYPF